MNESLLLDLRGVVRACPACGQRNRLLYERLDRTFRCTKCHAELPPPAEPMNAPGSPEFDAVSSKSALPTLADFWAPWCGPCRMVAPELEKVAAQGAGRWMVVKVNTEELPALGNRFEVRSIPTMVLFKGGREVARQSGAIPAPAIMEFIQKAR